MNKRIFIITMLLAISPVSTAHAQETQAKSVTLKTYFPQPMGSYARIQMLEDSSTPPQGSCDIGAMVSVSIDDGFLPRRAIYACYKQDFFDEGEWRPLQGAWSSHRTLEIPVETSVFLSDVDHQADLRVGIGTQNPELQLSLNHDGGILALDAWGQGENLLTAATDLNEPRTRFIWHPQKAAFRAGSGRLTSDHPWRDTQIGLYSTALGYENISNGQSAMIYGGASNVTRHNFSVIGGGLANTMPSPDCGGFNVIAGGRHNQILSQDFGFACATTLNSIIVGGNNNIIEPYYHLNRSFQVIAGGSQNYINSTLSPDPSGDSSLGEADYAAIGGGFDNEIKGSMSVIIGGQGNFSNGVSSAIGGGFLNRSSASDSFIAGGERNEIIPLNTSIPLLGDLRGNAIIGGANNIAGSVSSLVLGGYSNESRSEHSTVGGGQSNIIAAPTTGTNNMRFNTILGGHNNRIDSNPDPSVWTGISRNGPIYCFIGGGDSNRISTIAVQGIWTNESLPTNSIGGGQNNIIEARASTIGGGKNNVIPRNAQMIDSTYVHSNTGATIPGGENNTNNSRLSWVGGKNMTSAVTQWFGNGANFHFLWGHSDTKLDAPGWVARDPREASDAWYKNSMFVIYGNDVRVGIQTTTPQEKLHVNGHTHASGRLLLTALPWVTGVAPRIKIGYDDKFYTLDLAESFDADHEVSAGTVLTISPDQSAIRLTPSSSAYDPNVIGVVSTSPAVVLKGHETIMMPDPAEFAVPTNTPPIALKGRVPVKVTLENGPIQPGDALTTSSLPGHAMKSTDWDRSWGTTIGKAMEPFTGGPNGETEGMIMAFVAIY